MNVSPDLDETEKNDLRKKDHVKYTPRDDNSKIFKRILKIKDK